MGTVVSQDEVFPAGDNDGCSFLKKIAGGGVNGRVKILFFKELFVYIDLPVFNGNPFARKTDYPLDKLLPIVGGGFKNNDVAPIGFAKAVRNLIG